MKFKKSKIKAERLLIPSKLIGFTSNVTKLNIIYKKSQRWFT